MSRQSAARTASSSAPGMTRSLQSLPQSLSRSLGARAATTLPGVLSIQRDSTQSATEQGAAASVRGVLSEPGRPLDAPTRSSMESHLGYDLSSVRVHTDERAAASAQAVNAGAYTAGSHIAFDTGRYSPGTLGGRNLMAHELTHVVQQAQGPVAGTPIGDGVQVSHPSDSFEREARASGVELGTQRSGPERAVQNLETPPAHASSLSIQRTTSDQDISNTNSAASSASAAQSSASASWLSASAGVLSSLSSVASAYAGIRAANFAGRSAEAAEDPPTAEPTGGGVSTTDVDIPEVKGLNKADDPDTTVTTTGKDSERSTGKDQGENSGKSTTRRKGSASVNTQSGSSTTRRSGNAETDRSSVAITTKPADPPDFEQRYRLLNINQGPQNSVDFFLTIRANGADIKDGGTEPGPATGYDGGTMNSNASAVFRAKPGTHDEAGNASVRVLLGGTNTPPRKTLQKSGFFGGGGPEANKNYKVQKFGGMVRFYAAEGRPPVVERAYVGPDPKAIQTNSVKPNDEKTPIMTVSLSPDGGGPATILDMAPIPKATAPGTPAPPDTPDNGNRYA